MTAKTQHYETLLKKLIAFDTTSSQSNLDLIDFLDDYLSKLHFHTQRFYNQE